MKKPKISVIITAYNVGKYIEEAIQSVLNQTFKDYELIVVDDGSTDNTKEIVMKYKDKLKYYYKENSGHASAKNYGIKKSKADFIAFLDGDDMWLPNRLELGYKCIRKNQDVGVVYSSFTLIDINGRIINKKYDLLNIQNAYPSILLGNFIGFSGTLVKRECFKIYGYFFSPVDMYEDWDMWIRLSRKFRFSFINEPLFYYRSVHLNKLTKDQIKIKLKKQLIVLKRAFKEDNCLSKYFKLRCISNVYFDMAKFCFFRRQFIETLKLNLISIVYMPFQVKAYVFFPYTILKRFMKLNYIFFYLFFFLSIFMRL